MEKAFDKDVAMCAGEEEEVLDSWDRIICLGICRLRQMGAEITQEEPAFIGAGVDLGLLEDKLLDRQADRLEAEEG